MAREIAGSPVKSQGRQDGATRRPALPAEETFGRDADRKAVRERLARHPVVTLIGLGGTGKTHLARCLLREADGPAVWVEAASVSEPDLLVTAACEAADAAVRPGEHPLDALCRALRTDGTLLVLDNCEHLLDASAELTAELTARLPDLRVLTTSREALDVPGESVWRLAPLALPGATPSGDIAPESVLEAPAVGLFLARAQAANPDFDLTADNLADVLAICRGLEGIPLALELAAAQLRALSPGQLKERVLHAVDEIEERPGRRRPVRHRSMRAALEGSLALLAGKERRLFASLSVFRGGFTLPDCDAIAGEGFPDGTLAPLLALIDRSLVTVEPGSDPARYRLLEPVRQFAQQLLEESPRFEALQLAHAEHFARIAQAHAAKLKSGGRRTSVEILDRAAPNLAVAWRSAVSLGRQDIVGRFAEALFWYWNFSGRFAQGRELCRLALRSLSEQAPPVGLSWATGALDWIAGEPGRARERLEQALAEAGDSPGAQRGAILRELGGVCLTLGDTEAALRNFDEAETVFDAAGQAWDLALAQVVRGDTLELAGQLDAAERARTSARERFERLGDPWGKALAAFSYACGMARREQIQEARPAANTALQLQRTLGDRWNIAQCLVLLADLDLAEGDAGGACERLREALEQLRVVDDRSTTAYALVRLADAEAARGNEQVAARLLAVARAPWAAGSPPYPYALAKPDAVTALEARLAEKLDEATLMALTAEAATWERSRVLERVVTSTEVAAGTERDVRKRGPSLCIRALGELSVRRDNRVLTRQDWAYALPRELLMYFLLEGPSNKARLGLDLWPDASEGQLRGRFRSTLYQLRQTLGNAGWIRYHEGRYGFHEAGPWSFDVQNFEETSRAGLAATARGEPSGLELLEQALSFYRGELLQGESFGDWVVPHRERLAQRRVEIALAAARIHLDAGQGRTAADLLEPVVAEDPLQETATRLLAEGLWQAGSRGDALRALERLEKALREELDVAPDAETRVLQRRIASEL